MMEQHVGIFRSPQGSRYCFQNGSIKFEIWKCQFWRSCHSANTQLCWPCPCCNFENDQRTLGPASYPNGTMQGFPILVKFPGKIKEDFHDETLKRRHACCNHGISTCLTGHIPKHFCLQTFSALYPKSLAKDRVPIDCTVFYCFCTVDIVF